MATLAEIEAELQKRGVTTSTESVLEPKGTSFEEFKKFGDQFNIATFFQCSWSE